MWVLQHHSVHAFDMSTIIVFVYLGLQVKLNQFSSNNSHHTSCIHKGSHAGKWPDLMTSKPDSFSKWPPNQILSVHWDNTGQTTLEDHWSHKYTGMPLEPHWHCFVTQQYRFITHIYFRNNIITTYRYIYMCVCQANDTLFISVDVI